MSSLPLSACMASSGNCFLADGHVFTHVTSGTVVGPVSDTNLSLACVVFYVQGDLVHCSNVSCSVCFSLKLLGVFSSLECQSDILRQKYIARGNHLIPY
jgi:hypothetical protein